MAEDVKKQNPNQVLDEPIQEAAVVAEALDKTGAGNPVTNEVVEEIAQADTAEAVATPAAEAAPVEVSSEVTASGVTTHHEAEHAGEVLKNHTEGDVSPAGENHPTNVVDGSNIRLPDETFNTKDAKAVQKDPSSSVAAHNLVEEKRGLLARTREFFANKFLAGNIIPEQQVASVPGNVVQFPTTPTNPAPAQDKKAG